MSIFVTCSMEPIRRQTREIVLPMWTGSLRQEPRDPITNKLSCESKPLNNLTDPLRLSIHYPLHSTYPLLSPESTISQILSSCLHSSLCSTSHQLCSILPSYKQAPIPNTFPGAFIPLQVGTIYPSPISSKFQAGSILPVYFQELRPPEVHLVKWRRFVSSPCLSIRLKFSPTNHRPLFSHVTSFMKSCIRPYFSSFDWSTQLM